MEWPISTAFYFVTKEIHVYLGCAVEHKPNQDHSMPSLFLRISLSRTCTLIRSPSLKMTLFSAAIHQFLITAEVSITTHCHAALIRGKLRRELVIRKKPQHSSPREPCKARSVSRRDSAQNRERTNFSTSIGPGPQC